MRYCQDKLVRNKEGKYLKTMSKPSVALNLPLMLTPIHINATGSILNNTEQHLNKMTNILSNMHK